LRLICCWAEAGDQRRQNGQAADSLSDSSTPSILWGQPHFAQDWKLEKRGKFSDPTFALKVNTALVSGEGAERNRCNRSSLDSLKVSFSFPKGALHFGEAGLFKTLCIFVALSTLSHGKPQDGTWCTRKPSRGSAQSHHPEPPTPTLNPKKPNDPNAE